MKRTGGPGKLLAHAGTCLLALTLIIYTIYGAAFKYFDTVVFLCLLGAVVLSALWKPGQGMLRDSFHLISAGLTAYALGLFFLNSFPVWADNITHIKMYGSRGGLVPVVILSVLIMLAELVEIVNCFRDGAKGSNDLWVQQ